MCEGRLVRHAGHLLALSLATVAACGSSTTNATTAETPGPAPARAASPAANSADAVAALIGTTPPEWQVERWISSPPLSLASLRGSVVMVRWWTSGCPFCSATAPALRAFDREYGPRGLKVVGIYHHKEDTPFDPRVYEDTARKYEFTFPLAFDPDWRTLHSWLRDRDGNAVDPGWTSVTFVLDKRGVVRHVHPGGQYVDGDAAHAELRAVIDRLLAET
jgi:thiol-disulfide isomerase/thioredoxin